MKTLSPALIAAFDQSLKASTVPLGMQMDYRKWLRFYLDFCMKYRHPPRDPDSLEPFLQKLASKNQSKASQEQAAASVKLYYDIRTIQEMLGHSDVRTTMIYTHTVKSRTQKERKSPLDFKPKGANQ